MQLKDKKITYSLSVMEEYCRENIDKYNVEPIVREAFHAGLISVDIAFIHLRIAQMVANEEKITGQQIADEVGVSPSVITKYKKNHLQGISQKIFIQLLLMTHTKDMLDLWERSDFNQALADYVNKYRVMSIMDGESGDIQRIDYELEHDKRITKDVCRKIYKELISDKIKLQNSVSKEDYIISVNVIDYGEKIKAKVEWETDGESKLNDIECDKSNFVHELVYKIQNTVKGINTQRNVDVYLRRSRNRKVRMAMEYLALTKKNVYLIYR